MLERALASMRSMRAARRSKIQFGSSSSMGSRCGGTAPTCAGVMPAWRSTASASRCSAASTRRQSRSRSCARSGRPDSAFTGLFRFSSSLPHCSGRRSACSCSGRPAAANSGSQGRSAGWSCAASTPALPRWKWPGASSAMLNGTMPGSTVRPGRAAAACAALSMPFCSDSTRPPGASTAASACAASAVAPLFTHSSTSAASAGPGGSGGGAVCRRSVAAGSCWRRPSRSVSVRPWVRRASSTRGRPTKCTSAPAACSQPPTWQPTAPAPITSTGPGAGAGIRWPGARGRGSGSARHVPRCARSAA